jgi:antitoxin YefM
MISPRQRRVREFSPRRRDQFAFRTAFLYALGMVETTYTSLRENLASMMDRVVNDREVVIVSRKGDKKVAIIPADELSGLLETAHLLRSPKNAKRLLQALRRATSRKGKPQSLDKFRRELNLVPR